MNLTPREIVLATIAEAGGTIQGRTLLQKRVYFLEILLGVYLGYRPHYYGPYSPLVDSALGELQGLRFVEEHQRGFGTNEDGFEVKRYDYELTQDGQVIARLLAERRGSDYQAVAQALRRLREAGDPDYLTLSVAAKTHYILHCKGAPMTGDEIREVGGRLNWKISDTQLNEAVAFLARLGLVQQHS